MKTDILQLKITKIAFGGAGIGTDRDGTICFVPSTVPGETVTATILKNKKNFRECRLIEIIDPAPERCATFCPLAGKLCPGCSYQHLSYEAEIAVKQQQLADFLAVLPGFEMPMLMPPLPSAQDRFYRNKLTLQTPPEQNETALGYVMTDNYHVIDVPQCPLASPAINAKLAELRKKTGFFHTLRTKMKVTFRDCGGDVLYWRNNPPEKMSWLKENTAFGLVSVPLGSFFQVNPLAGDVLLQKIAAWLREIKPGLFLDLYCGCGFFSIAAAAASVPEIIGLDADDIGIAAAKYNLRHANATFIAGNAEKLLPEMLPKIDRGNTALVVDPPRTGLHKTALATIISAEIKNIAYVSCSPDTLVRDLKVFIAAGYSLSSVQLVDMFPRTSHFETIAFLTIIGVK